MFCGSVSFTFQMVQPQCLGCMAESWTKLSAYSIQHNISIYILLYICISIAYYNSLWNTCMLLLLSWLGNRIIIFAAPGPTIFFQAPAATSAHLTAFDYWSSRIRIFFCMNNWPVSTFFLHQQWGPRGKCCDHPQTKRSRTPPPSTQKRFTPPPITHQRCTPPPSTQQRFTPPPSTQQRCTPPPSTKQWCKPQTCTQLRWPPQPSTQQRWSPLVLVHIRDVHLLS